MLKGHGGNIFDLAQTLGCQPSDILDMSSNVNPLGPPPGLMDYLHQTLETIVCLPEVDAGNAVQAFAQHHQIDPECVIAGNGTTQLIYTIPLALETQRAMILGPTYSDYADACKMHKVPYTYLIAWESMDFDHDLTRVETALKSVDTVFICNPNNPTGRLIPGDDLVTLCQNHPEVFFIIDESYMPFVPEGHTDHSLLHQQLDNVIVLNSMSKIFRVPGLRIGFLISSPKTIQRFQRYLMPWSVNSVAQSAIGYLMDHQPEIDQFCQTSREYLAAERQFFHQAVETATGLKAFPSVTSFILIRILNHRTSFDMWQRMAQHGILIRDCSNFKGLVDQYVRISLKTRKQNQMVIEKLLKLSET